jgi:drug/metabolite transporter (DMT)-like permease
MEKILIAFGLIFFTTVGQLLLKKATQIGGIKNIYLWAGYSFFVVTIFVSYLLMQYIELKYFTVIMSLNYITVMIASSLFFGERLSVMKVLGTILVLLGIGIFMNGAQ